MNSIPPTDEKRTTPSHLSVGGEVARPLQLTSADLAAFPAADQIGDVTTLGARRPGRAVRLASILRAARPTGEVTHIGLHATRDDFHASIPLAPIEKTAVVIFADSDGPLSDAAGGPFRFFIPDHAACHTDEIDECANVKFVDRIELTVGKGFDNRPTDDEAHERLHRS